MSACPYEPFATTPAMGRGMNGQITRRTRRWLCRGVLALSLACAFSGCLSRPALVHQTFALSAVTPSQPIYPNGQGVVALRRVQVCPLFEGRSLVYRVAENQYQADPYAEFMVAPGRALAIPLRTYLRCAGLFEDVLEPGSQDFADTFLEVHIEELYGDFRTNTAPAAVLALRFVLWAPEPGAKPSVVFQKEYLRRVRLNQPSATSLVAGWNQALEEIMRKVCSEIATARPVALVP